MSTVLCPNCNHTNPTGTKFCQKCGTSLVMKGRICRQCGASNSQEAEFCGNCGTKLSEAKFSLTSESASNWRSILGAYEGMSPSFVPSKEILSAWSKLDPPVIPENEIFIFDVPILLKNIVGKPPAFAPRSALQVLSVKIHEEVIHAVTTAWRAEWAYLLATQSRLVAYLPYKERAWQVPYDQFVSLDMQGNKFILGLRDGSEAEIEAIFSRPGLLAAMAVLGAPTGLEKGMILDREKAKARTAHSLATDLVQFFMEIIQEVKRRGG